MKHSTKLFKVKDEYAQEVLSWFKYVNTYLNENPEYKNQLLDEEGLAEEEAFMFCLSDGWYCLGHMRVEDKKLPPDMSHEINKKHAELMDKAMVPVYKERRDHLVYRLKRT